LASICHRVSELTPNKSFQRIVRKLTPVSMGELRGAPNARGLSELAQRVVDRETVSNHDAEGLIDGALWLQKLLLAPEVLDPPWGPFQPIVRRQMLDAVARIMMSECATEFVQRCLPGAT